MVFSRGFRGKRRDGPPARVPPGQYLTDDFPGPLTPHTPLEEWTFTIQGGYEPHGSGPSVSERWGAEMEIQDLKLDGNAIGGSCSSSSEPT